MSYERIDSIIKELDSLEVEINTLKTEYRASNYCPDILSKITEASSTTATLIEEWVSTSRRLRNTR